VTSNAPIGGLNNSLVCEVASFAVQGPERRQASNAEKFRHPAVEESSLINFWDPERPSHTDTQKNHRNSSKTFWL